MKLACLQLRVRGATLIELVFFLVIIGIALAATIAVFSQSIRSSNDPLIQARALELAQAQLDDVLARKFDENTPSGGVPACDSNNAGAVACLGISPDADFDDVGDFNGYTDNSHTGYQIDVTVTAAGTDLGLAAAQARLITVVVSTPGTSASPSGGDLTLSAYKVNF